MVEPVYSETTERMYGRLPDAYRREDEGQGYALKRYLSSLGEQLFDVDHLIERFRFVTMDSGGAPDDTSDLVNPITADAEWLPWLAMLMGLRLRSSVVATNRQQIIAATSFKAGTKQSIGVAAQAALTGDKQVAVYDHSNAGGPGSGGQWDVLIVTKATETVGNVIDEVIKAGVKPAGVILYAATFEASWATIEAARPTWTSWDGYTWQQIEETGL